MSSLEQVSPAVGRRQPRSLPCVFGQTMGLVALTVGVAALGAYLGRDLTRGWGIVAFIGAIACILGLNVAVQRSEQLAIGLLFGLGALLGDRARLPSSPTTPPSIRRRCGRPAPRPRSSSAASARTGTRPGAIFRSSRESPSSHCSA